MLRRDRQKRNTSRVYVFSEHAIYCDSLRSLLTARCGFSVVGSTTDSPTLANAAHACCPDVLLVDLHTPLGPRSRGMPEVLAACRSVPTIVMAPQLEPREVSGALRLGIRGVIMKGANTEALFNGIRAVAGGSCWIDRDIFAGVVHMLSTDGPQQQNGSPHGPFGLTAREIEIVSVVLEGGANKQIAIKCGITEKTVKHHLTNIFDKVGVSNRLELAVFAIEHQLVMRP